MSPGHESSTIPTCPMALGTASSMPEVSAPEPDPWDSPCCRGMLDLLQVRITEMWSAPAPTFSWVLSSPTADL